MYCNGEGTCIETSYSILKQENGLTKAAAQGNKLAINALKQLDKAGV